MTNTKAKLLRLVAQLTDPSLAGELLRQRFNRLPINVMDDYDLEPEARAALLTMKSTKIADYIKSELQVWAFPPGEFPEPDPKCYIPPPSPPQAAYGMPDPQFKAIRPIDGPAGTQAFDFTLYGEGLLLPLKVELAPKGGGASIYYDDTNAQIVREGTFRCGRVKVTADLPTVPATYDVKVYDLLGPKPTDIFEIPNIGVTFNVTP